MLAPALLRQHRATHPGSPGPSACSCGAGAPQGLTAPHFLVLYRETGIQQPEGCSCTQGTRFPRGSLGTPASTCTYPRTEATRVHFPTHGAGHSTGSLGARPERCRGSTGASPARRWDQAFGTHPGVALQGTRPFVTSITPPPCANADLHNFSLPPTLPAGARLLLPSSARGRLPSPLNRCHTPQQRCCSSLHALPYPEHVQGLQSTPKNVGWGEQKHSWCPAL